MWAFGARAVPILHFSFVITSQIIMKKCLFILLLLVGATAMAKDCDCELKKELPEKTDYCFQDQKQFPQLCAAFVDRQSYFYLILKGKKITKIEPNQELEGTAQLLDLVSRYKIKKAIDVLFVKAALADWQVARYKIGFVFTESGLGIKKLKEGQGEKPQQGQKATVHYTGWLEDGTKFDSSVDRGTPFSFQVGGRVIDGWNEGITHLPVGTKALLRIPPELGYGNRGAGGGAIPPGATLIFEIEVLEVN